MKQLYITITVLLVYINSFGQIGGLSSAKVISLTADVLENKTIEFEPGFYHVRTSQYWDINSNLQNIYSTSDSIKLITGMYFRFTYGLWDKIEMGVIISNDMSSSQWGIQYRIYDKGDCAFALISGVNLSWGNRPIDERLRVNSDIGKVGFGVVGSVYRTRRFSMDFSAQYMQFIKKSASNNNSKLYFSFDAGCYFFDNQLQLMAATEYRFISKYHDVLTISPGISVETGNNYALAFSFPFDIYGRGETKNKAINFALTLNFN